MSEGTPQAPSAPTTNTPAAPQGAQAPQQGQPQAPATPEEMHELNVNGKTIKVTRAELIKRAQLAEAAGERFEQGAQLSKKAQSIIEEATKNPIGSLIKAGLSKDQIKLAMEEWYTREFIEPESLTPEQIRLRDAEAELKTFREEQAAKKKAEEDQAQNELTSKQREILSRQIMDALDSSGLPRTKFIASRVAFYMRENVTKGWGAPMELIVEQVRGEEQERWRQMAGESTVEQMLSLLGEDVINKIRAHDLAKLREKRGMPKLDPGGVGSSGGRAERPSEKVSMDDVAKRLRKLQFGV